MKHKILILAGLAALAGVPAANAESIIEPDYTHKKPRVATPWYIAVSPGQKAADLAFIEAMRPHHAGALSMSRDYLANPQASNHMLKQLARGIIHNQEFEISMLDRVESCLNNADEGVAQVAAKGLAQEQRFFRAPMPGILDFLAGDDSTTEADVKFAKAMIVHHEGALTMCRDYLEANDSRNGYLRRMCLDILTDQAQEIAFMKDQMEKYQGDIEQVAFDPSMVHGMDHMMHGMKNNHAHH